MQSGSIAIVEPWVPDDQVVREVTVVGRGLSDDSLLLMSDVPIGWGDWGLGELLIVRPRHVGSSLDLGGKVQVNGAIWGGKWKEPLRFVGTLEIEALAPPEGPC
jgi:hypothetical protein